MSLPILRPRPRGNIALSVSFNFPMACFDALNFGYLFQVIVYPKNFLFHGRSTALLASLTFNFSLLLKNNVTDSFTRSPALCVCTYMLLSSAYRQNLCSLLSNSLSKSSSRIFDNNGDNGPPCGVPSVLAFVNPSSIIPACR